MIKVLEIFGEPISYGGQESFVFKNIANMNRKDLQFHFLTPYYADNETYTNFIDMIGGKLYKLNLPFNPGKSRMNICPGIKKILKNQNYDIVHVHTGSISVLVICSVLAKRYGVKKVVLHSHMGGAGLTFKHRVLQFFSNLIFTRSADILLAPTNEAAEWQFSRKLFIRKGQILKNGINLDQYSYNKESREKYRKLLSYSNKNVVLGNVGRLSFEKNQEFLIRLLKFLPSNHRLLLVGNGIDKEKLISIAKEQNVFSRIDFVGNVNNVEDYLQAMDIFLFPSLFEGLGIAAVEAQVSGLAVVASQKVPKDVKIIDNVKFLSLSNTKKWLDEISLLSKLRSMNGVECAKNKGYDIKDTAEELRRIYLK